jgi:NAD(P)-dependent dehydrogenase (short-subunit alcohol dehydrogenase family)
MNECKLRAIPDPSRRFESSHIVHVRGTAIAAQGGRSTEVARNRCALPVGGQQVRDVAAAVGYPVSPAAKFITGTIRPVDGGVAMR